MVFRIGFFRNRQAASLMKDWEARGKDVDFQKMYRDLLDKGFKDVAEEYPINELADKSARPTTVYVEWGCAVVAPLSTFIATDELNGCAALKVIDREAGLQYLIHVLRDETITSMIEHSLFQAGKLGIDLEHSEIELMPGLFTGKLPSPRILEALYRINPKLIEKVSLIRDLSRDREKQGLIMHGGKTYRYPKDWVPFDYRYYRAGKSKHSIAEHGFTRVL